jgi:hypothetical protein
MSNNIKDDNLSEEQAKLASEKGNFILGVVQKLAKHDHDQSELFKAWSEGQKIKAQQVPGQVINGDGDDAQEKHLASDDYRDRKPGDTEIPFDDSKAENPDNHNLPKQSPTSNQFGLEGIQERWKDFEQKQAKAMQGINQLEQGMENAQDKLTKFEEKHGDYLAKSKKQATGGDPTKIKAYDKLKSDYEKLQDEVGAGEKSLENARKQYQKDHHTFHGDSWNRVAEQAKVDGFAPFVDKAERKAQEHHEHASELEKQLPAEVFSRSVTAQKVADEVERSNDIRQKAVTDPTLRKEIANGLELAQSIGQDTQRRTESRADELQQRHKIKQKP